MSSEPTLCSDCIKGVRHEGTPTGTIEKIAGVDVYVALPSGEYDKEKALLYLPDALGLSLWNAQVYMIDYFDGDPVPLNLLTEKDFKFDLPAWIGKHPAEVTRPLLDPVIAALKERGIKEFGATGYCFGGKKKPLPDNHSMLTKYTKHQGKYVFNLAQEGTIKVGVVSHPSLLKMPDDLETLLAKSKAPMLINSCDVDGQFPKESCELADNLLGDGKYAPGYKRVHWKGCVHGFAVRGDLSDPLVKAGKEGSFKETAAWIKKYL
ncbi:dienelactone hydrolase [Hysterangium stoloniferum]|nr:dienelactone hydrolase [Hysterangium stoloniferum]